MKVVLLVKTRDGLGLTDPHILGGWLACSRAGGDASSAKRIEWGDTEIGKRKTEIGLLTSDF